MTCDKLFRSGFRPEPERAETLGRRSGSGFPPFRIFSGTLRNGRIPDFAGKIRNGFRPFRNASERVSTLRFGTYESLRFLVYPNLAGLDQGICKRGQLVAAL